MAVQFVENIMSKEVIASSGDAPITEILRILSKSKISFVVISNDEKPIGVITERDIVNLTAKHVDVNQLQAEEVMSQPVVVIKGSNVDIAEAYHRLKMQNKRHLVVVDEHDGEIIGVVTATDFVRHLGVEAFIEHKPLRHVLTGSPITIDPSEMLIDAVNLMAEHKISSVIITEEGKPVGIITERDIARIRAANSCNVLTTPVGEVMTKPVVTVPPEMSTFDASKLMQSNLMRHLVVTDPASGIVVGVVTETNIINGMEGRYVKSLVELLDAKDAELRAINDELEQRVKERTEQLTREVRAHEAAREAMHKLTQALRQAGEAVVITDAHGNIEYVNESFTETTGYSLLDVMGKNPRILQSGSQDKSFYRQMWKSLNETGAWQGVVWNKKKSGQIYPEQLHIRSIRNNEGKVLNYVGTFSDISEKLAMETELRHAQKMEAIGTLVGGVAHNFNNILAGLLGKLYLGRVHAENNPKLIPYFNSMEQLSNRAADIVRQLLVFARKEISEKTKISLTGVMKDALKTAQIGVPEDIVLITNFPDEPLTILGDASQLQQVMLNMVSNARDSLTDEMPRSISVSLKRLDIGSRGIGINSAISGEVACLRIEDSGSGILEKDLEHIFDPFFTTKEVGKGTGLGLSMTKGTVESHGGAIEVESTTGKGTVFSIYFPLIEDQSEGFGDDPSVSAIPGNGELILLVDDEEIILESTSNVLESLGYRVITAMDGEGGLAKFMHRKEELAAVITDIVMPKSGGYSLADEIRKHSNVPIIFLTGYDYQGETWGEDPRTAILTKPFNYQQLSVILNGLLNS